MDITLLQQALSTQSIGHLRQRARSDERGEGVISAAIAVLIMAVIGAALFVAFNHTRQNIQQRVDTGVESIQAT